MAITPDELAHVGHPLESCPFGKPLYNCMCKLILDGGVFISLVGNTFRKWPQNLEIHESFLPRKFFRYTVQWQKRLNDY